jgi:hypothetical protein
MPPIFAVVTIDYTIHVSDLATLGAMLTVFYKVFQAFRDEIRDIRRIVGHEGPPKGPSGLVHSILGLRDELDGHTLALVAAGIDPRTGERRTDDERRRLERRRGPA